MADGVDIAALVAESQLQLEQKGLLMISDGRLPSIAGIVTGAPVQGSWWGHERGRDIYATVEAVSELPDTLVLKLIAGKLTCIHRRLWPAILAVGTGKESWQLERLSGPSRALLEKVEKAGELPPDPPKRGDADPRQKAAALELEARMLVLTRSVHTDSGAHARVLESWTHWSRRSSLKARPVPVAAAKTSLEDAARGLDAQGRTPPLPWKV